MKEKRKGHIERKKKMIVLLHILPIPAYINSSYIDQHSKAGEVTADTFYYGVTALGNC